MFCLWWRCSCQPLSDLSGQSACSPSSLGSPIGLTLRLLHSELCSHPNLPLLNPHLTERCPPSCITWSLVPIPDSLLFLVPRVGASLSFSILSVPFSLFTSPEPSQCSSERGDSLSCLDHGNHLLEVSLPAYHHLQTKLFGTVRGFLFRCNTDLASTWFEIYPDALRMKLTRFTMT